MLIDTSIWIDFFRGEETYQTTILENAIENRDNLYICGVILTELLQGINKPKEYQLVQSALKPITYLEMNQDTFLLAADIFKQLRTKGITVRKTINCMIAAVAIENNLLLLHADKDFIPIEKHCNLHSFSPSVN